MKRLLIVTIAALLCGRVDVHADPPATAPAPAGWELTWSDEFDGTGIDRSKWDFDIGTGYWIDGHNGKPGQWVNGWGNNELEYYTDRNANAYVKDGALHIKAIKENYRGGHYTSARLRSGGAGEIPLFAQVYGRFEFRAKLPTGQGYWPALWLLPQDNAYGGWPFSGEIDVMENRGAHPDIVQGTILYAGDPKVVWHGKEYRLPDHGTVADFHVYALEWNPGDIRWSVDGVEYAKRDNWFTNPKNKDAPAWPAPFDKPFHLLMNVAVGGNFGGNPTDETVFPQEMVVDYVRAYRRFGGPGAVKPQGDQDASKSVVEKAEAVK